MITSKIAWLQVLFIPLLYLSACTPAADPHTASITGGIYFDCDKDGECADDETGIADMCVRLYSGACGEDLMQTHSTNDKGEFTFTELAAGDYCVLSDFELKTCGFGGNFPTTSISRSVTLEVGMKADLEWFGFGDISGQPETDSTAPDNAEPENVEPDSAVSENAEPENIEIENVEPENVEPENAEPDNSDS